MKFKYDFFTHLGLFILYNWVFLLVYIFTICITQDWRVDMLNNYFWNGKLFYYFPAKYIHLLINLWIFYWVKFKIM